MKPTVKSRRKTKCTCRLPQLQPLRLPPSLLSRGQFFPIGAVERSLSSFASFASNVLFSNLPIMDRMIGKSLQHYRITEKLGAGGMGVVYRATDTKLGRDVAIKVLPEAFASDERRRRFQREAQLLAALNHPNIASIHGLEEVDGVHYLVLELVEGETLADKLRTGPLPLKEALTTALQIAEALDAAHEKSVIHRDLKPANTMVTPDGDVIVLDFGLAKAFAIHQDASGDDVAESPTLSAAATREGVILGTAAYMSPEQARGKEVDKRTDIFSFGAVLYEMLTGRRAFPGEDVSETLAAVIKTDPDWSHLPASTDPRIRALLQGCLQKNRKGAPAGHG